MPNVTITKYNKRFVRKAAGLLLTPYVYDTDDGRYYLGQNTYDIFAIVGDTISVAQEDGSTETIENEFYPLAVIENTTLGKWKFKAECLDMQNIVLKEIFSARIGHDGTGNVDGISAMPSDYKTMYCCVQILFGGNNPRLIMPKVLMTSSFNIGNLHSNVSRNTIQGTPLLTEICVTDTSRMMLSFVGDESPTYTPLTPLVFVPNNRDFGVLHHKDDSGSVAYSYFSMYNNSNVVQLNPENGEIVQL